jgi:hypothetical protein
LGGLVYQVRAPPDGLIRRCTYLADGHPIATSWYGVDLVDLVEERPDIEDRKIGGVASRARTASASVAAAVSWTEKIPDIAEA